MTDPRANCTTRKMTFTKRTIYIPENAADDLAWLETESKDRGFSRTLLEILHTARMQKQETKDAGPPETGDPRLTEAQHYYAAKFGYLKKDYQSDREILEICGTDRTYTMIDNLFRQISREHAEHYAYCKEQFEKEHPGLCELRE